MPLHCVGDVPDAVAGLGLCYAFVQGSLGDLEQFRPLGIDFAYCEGIAGIAVVSVKRDHAVGAHDVAFSQLVVGGEAVHYRLVDFDAKGAGEALVSETGGEASVVEYELAGDVVEAPRGHPGSHVLGDFAERAAHQGACCAHLFELFSCLDVDHCLMCRKVSSGCQKAALPVVRPLMRPSFMSPS